VLFATDSENELFVQTNLILEAIFKFFHMPEVIATKLDWFFLAVQLVSFVMEIAFCETFPLYLE